MVFADIWGEPKQKQVDAATAFVRAAGAGLVVCLGGGSAMDVGKIAATVAATDGAPADFAMEGRPLPQRSIPKICIPTTAGTGSEFSSTNIFTNDAGRKVWVWGAVTKPERVILDPELTVSLARGADCMDRPRRLRARAGGKHQCPAPSPGTTFMPMPRSR